MYIYGEILEYLYATKVKFLSITTIGSLNVIPTEITKKNIATATYMRKREETNFL
jgi:hypothetical protein